MASFAGGGFQESVNITKEMGQITSAKNSKFGIPSLDFEGTPTGIDIRKVVETGILPSINSARKQTAASPNHRLRRASRSSCSASARRSSDLTVAINSSCSYGCER